MARTAEVKRDALIGRATAAMETLIKQSLANEQLTKSKLDNDTQVKSHFRPKNVFIELQKCT